MCVASTMAAQINNTFEWAPYDCEPGTRLTVPSNDKWKPLGETNNQRVNMNANCVYINMSLSQNASFPFARVYGAINAYHPDITVWLHRDLGYVLIRPMLARRDVVLQVLITLLKHRSTGKQDLKLELVAASGAILYTCLMEICYSAYSYALAREAKKLLVSNNFMRASDAIRLVRNDTLLLPTTCVWSVRSVSPRRSSLKLKRRIRKKTARPQVVLEPAVDQIEIV